MKRSKVKYVKMATPTEKASASNLSDKYHNDNDFKQGVDRIFLLRGKYTHMYFI